MKKNRVGRTLPSRENSRLRSKTLTGDIKCQGTHHLTGGKELRGYPLKMKPQRLVSFLMVVALLGFAFLASPVIAPKAPAQEFQITLVGDVAASFPQEAGNKAATKFVKGALATVDLDGLETLVGDLTSHLTFACDPRDPVGDPAEQQLDDATWRQGTLFVGKDGIFMRFQILITCDTNDDGEEDGRDSFLVIISVEDDDPFVSDDGKTREFDSTNVKITLIHNGVQDDLNKKGKKTISHSEDGHAPFKETFAGDITVTITES